MRLLRGVPSSQTWGLVIGMCELRAFSKKKEIKIGIFEFHLSRQKSTA